MTTTKEQYVAWFLIHNNFIGISFALLEIEIPHFCFRSCEFEPFEFNYETKKSTF